jgi:hypothetical protein
MASARAEKARDSNYAVTDTISANPLRQAALRLPIGPEA